MAMFDITAGQVEAATGVLIAFATAQTFFINSLIQRGIKSLNGKYVQTPVFAAKHAVIDQKLDGLKEYQSEKFHNLQNTMLQFTAVQNELGRSQADIAKDIQKIDNRVVRLEEFRLSQHG